MLRMSGNGISAGHEVRHGMLSVFSILVTKEVFPVVFRKVISAHPWHQQEQVEAVLVAMEVLLPSEDMFTSVSSQARFARDSGLFMVGTAAD